MTVATAQEPSAWPLCSSVAVLNPSSPMGSISSFAELRRETRAHRANRCRGWHREAGEWLGPAARALAHADQLGPLDVEGILILRSIGQECTERILEAQSGVLYAEKRAAPNLAKAKKCGSNQKLLFKSSWVSSVVRIKPGNRSSLCSWCRVVPLRYNAENAFVLHFEE